MKTLFFQIKYFLYRVIRRIGYFFYYAYVQMDVELQLRHVRCKKEKPKVMGPIHINRGENMTVGTGVSINKHFFAQAFGKITIGNHVRFGRNVKILTDSHNYMSPSALPFDEKRIQKDVVIGDCVWICDDVRILPGVTIGEGAVIAMGAIVTKNVPPLAVMGSSPAQLIKMRDKKKYWQLKYDQKFF